VSLFCRMSLLASFHMFVSLWDLSPPPLVSLISCFPRWPRPEQPIARHALPASTMFFFFLRFSYRPDSSPPYKRVDRSLLGPLRVVRDSHGAHFVLPHSPSLILFRTGCQGFDASHGSLLAASSSGPPRLGISVIVHQKEEWISAYSRRSPGAFETPLLNVT